jgi:hypothetical protein
MADTSDLLREAVGSWEPVGDERAVERRVARRRRRREVSSAIVALGVFVAGGLLAWSTLGPNGGVPGSAERDSYLLSGFEVAPHVDPSTGSVDPSRADVSFTARWSADAYPGVHRCRLRVTDVSGARIGFRALELSSLSRGRGFTMAVPVSGELAGASAAGSCDTRRLDAAVAVEISDVRFGYVDGRLAVVYEVGAPDGREVSTQACTSAVWDEDGALLGSSTFTSNASGGTGSAGLGADEAVARAEAAVATVTCVPFVHPGEFPRPLPPTVSSTSPKTNVGAPTGAS